MAPKRLDNEIKRLQLAASLTFRTDRLLFENWLRPGLTRTCGTARRRSRRADYGCAKLHTNRFRFLYLTRLLCAYPFRFSKTEEEGCQT
jgi:hypothetical protein